MGRVERIVLRIAEVMRIYDYGLVVPMLPPADDFPIFRITVEQAIVEEMRTCLRT